MKMTPVPFVGGFYADETRPWSVQDCVNWLPTQAEAAGTRTPTILKTPPGLRQVVTQGSSPIRGTYNAEGIFLFVAGNTLYRMNTDFTTTSIGTIPGVTRVRFAHNQQGTGNQVVIVNGTAGWVYDTAAKTLTRITDDGYPGAINAVFLASYIVQIEPARRFAFNSAPADATSYNTLDRFTSEVSPDLLMSMAVNNNELILFSENTTEFFQATSNAEQPFRSKQIALTRGCGGRYTVANIDNTVYWLGDDGIFYLMAGYSPQRVSTRPIEESIKGLNWDQAFAFTWESAGHKVVYWTFPDGTTWGYDVSAQQWSRRQSYQLNRWRPNTMTFWNGKWYAGDFQTGIIWEVDWDYMLEGTQKFESIRTTGVLSDNQNWLIVSRLELLMQVGQESTPISDPDNYVRVQYSDDGGNTWSNWDQFEIGIVGEYDTRPYFTRQGKTRHRTYRILCSSPRKRDLMGAMIVVQGTVG
jgi:hypothetical protein